MCRSHLKVLAKVMFLSDYTTKHPPGSILDTSHDLYVSYVCILCHFIIYEPQHEISNNVVCATSNASDQPAHTRSLIRAFASRLHNL